MSITKILGTAVTSLTLTLPIAKAESQLNRTISQSTLPQQISKGSSKLLTDTFEPAVKYSMMPQHKRGRLSKEEMQKIAEASKQYMAQKTALMPQHKRGRLSLEERQKIAEASKKYMAQKTALMPQHKRGRLSLEERQKIAEASKQYKK